MPKIPKMDENLVEVPKGATIRKDQSVYVNQGNYRSISKKTGKAYTNHNKVKIGVMYVGDSENCKGKMYANKNYRMIFDQENLPELPERADAQHIGVKLVINKICQEYKLFDILGETFENDEVNLIIDLSMYMCMESSGVFQHFPIWAWENDIYSSKIRSDSYISKFLGDILTCSKIKKFLKKWAQNNIGNGNVYFCYDSTNVNTKAEGIFIAQKGYAKDNKNIPQVNTEYIVRQEDGVPLTFSDFPGSIVDISEASEMIEFLKEIVENFLITLVCDRGYISAENIEKLTQAGIDFLLMLRSNMNDVKDLLDKYAKNLKTDIDSHYKDEGFYGQTIEMPLYGEGENKCFNIIYSRNLEGEHIDKFHQELYRKEKFLQSCIDKKKNITSREIKEHSKWHNLSVGKGDVIELPVNGRSHKTHLIQHYKILSYQRNKRKIKKTYDKCGCYILLSSKIISPLEAKIAYSKRDCVEKVFQALKSSLGMDKFGIHSDENLHGKSLIWFVASIFRAVLIKKTEKLRENNKKLYTFPAIVKELKTITADRNLDKNKYEKRYKLDKMQKNILECFNLDLDNINIHINSMNKKTI